MKIRDMKIGTRLGGAFGVMVLFIILVSGYGVYQMNHLADLTSEMYEHPMTVSKALLGIERGIYSMHLRMDGVPQTKDPAVLDKTSAEINGFEQQVEKDFAVVRGRFLGDQQKMDAAYKAFQDWKPIRNRIIALARQGNLAESGKVEKRQEDSQAAMLDRKIQYMVDFAKNEETSFYHETQATRSRVILVTVVFSLAVILCALLLGFVITRDSTEPLTDLAAKAARMADYDLSVTFTEDTRQDEIGRLAKAFQHMQRNIRQQTTQVKSGTNSLVAALSQISTTISELAASSAETSTTTTEITATVEEIRHTAHLVNDKAEHVAEGAAQVVKVYDAGKKATEDTMAGMSNIREEMEYIAESIVQLNEQSQSIGEIISTVNDFADQSNLLSVNASIEAAKAGEYGKGFAVVAQEVKMLAEQSKEATKQIKTLLNDIQKATSAAVLATERGSKAVDRGVDLSRQAGIAIQQLTDSIAESANAAGQISATSQQQLNGMDQLATAMESIKAAARQNMDGAKQLESAAKSLENLSGKLKESTEKFRV